MTGGAAAVAGVVAAGFGHFQQAEMATRRGMVKVELQIYPCILYCMLILCMIYNIVLFCVNDENNVLKPHIGIVRSILSGVAVTFWRLRHLRWNGQFQ